MPDPGVGSFTPINIFAMLRALVNNNAPILTNAGAPTSGTSGTYVGLAGPGAMLIDYTNAQMYINTNTLASPTWTKLPNGAANSVTAAMLSTDSLQKVTGTISSANITGTGAGQFGHANGVVLQAAPGANVALQPIALGMYYTFATAAYTGGGNISLNWGAGGAALTGVVSAANSVGAASNKALMFFPLSTAGVAIVSNASLNLVAAAAFTQPGTAAGTIAWELWYRTMAVGF